MTMLADLRTPDGGRPARGGPAPNLLYPRNPPCLSAIARSAGRMVALLLAVAALAMPAPAAPAVHGEISAEELQQRIERLVGDIKAEQDPSGAFGLRQNQNWGLGQTALAVMAFRSAGLAADDPAVRRAVSYLLDHQGEGQQGVYQTSLKIMALESLDPKAYKGQIEAGAHYLIRAQQGSGGWSYTERGQTDNSNSQFAVLGLNSAA